jgi:hypothetical protein
MPKLVQSPLLLKMTKPEKQQVLDMRRERGYLFLKKQIQKYISEEQERLIFSGGATSTEDIRKSLQIMNVLQGIIDLPKVIEDKIRDLS